MRWNRLAVAAFGFALLLASGCGKSSGPGNTLEVSPDPILMVRNDTARLSVTVLDGDGNLVTGVSVLFTSADTLIVTVTSVGVVHSKNTLGNTTIRVRGAGASKDIAVHVTATPAAVVVAPADTTIFQNDTARFRAAVLDASGDTIPGLTFSWQTTDSTIATISSTGLAHSSLRAGSVTVQARYSTFVGNANLGVRDTIILGNRVALAGQPYGAAISSANVAYVTLGSAAHLARADLPSQAFASAVAVGSAPSEVAFTSNGSIAYVTNQLNQNVGIVNVATNTQTDNIVVNGDPFEVIVEPGDSIIYVSTNVNKVYGIRVATKALVDSFPTPAIGNGMLIKDTLLYVSTHSGGTIIEFNLKARAVARTFTVGGTPQKMALSTDGNTLYIANEAGYVQFWNRITGAQIGTNVPIGGAGYGIALRPTTGLLYATASSNGGIDVLDPATRTVITSVITGGSARHIVFAASGIGFVPNEGGWVDFIK